MDTCVIIRNYFYFIGPALIMVITNVILEKSIFERRAKLNFNYFLKFRLFYIFQIILRKRKEMQFLFQKQKHTRNITKDILFIYSKKREEQEYIDHLSNHLEAEESHRQEMRESMIDDWRGCD